MFRSEVPGKYEPYKIREKIVKRTVQATTEPQNGAEGANNDAITTETQEDRVVYEEDMTSDEDAVYPIVKGRVYNWECFFALLEHIHNTLSPPFHTPVLFLMPSGWVPKEHEYLARFWFEKFKIPALVLMDACLATCWAYSTPSATVVDVGYDKTDVTTVTDFWPCPVSRLLSLPGPSGEAMTRRLEEMLGPKGFTHDMCEQLKKNPICEILPPGTALPSEAEAPESANPAAAASTGVNGNAAVGNAKPATVQNGLPRGPGPGTEIGVEQADDNEGVLDVASIVASGKTSEFLAKKEREKAERAAKRAAAAAADAAPKAAKLSNSQKANAVFHYDEPRKAEEGTNGEATVGDAAKENVTGKESAAEPPTNGEASVSADGPSNAPEPAPLSKKEEKKRIRESSGYVRKELEVGVERFKAGEEVIERVIDAIYTNIMGFPDPYERHKFWDSLILCGNGSKVKGKPPTPFAQFFSSEQWLIIPFCRLQRCRARSSQRQVLEVTVQRHDVHFRVALELLHSRPDGCQYADTTGSANASCLRRQPAPPRRHHGAEPGPRDARRPPPSVLRCRRRVHARLRHARRPQAAAARAAAPDADEHPLRQAAGVLPGVEGSRPGGGALPRRPDRGQGPVRGQAAGAPGYERAGRGPAPLHDAHRLQRARPLGHPRLRHRLSGTWVFRSEWENGAVGFCRQRWALVERIDGITASVEHVARSCYRCLRFSGHCIRGGQTETLIVHWASVLHGTNELINHDHLSKLVVKSLGCYNYALARRAYRIGQSAELTIRHGWLL